MSQKKPRGASKLAQPEHSSGSKVLTREKLLSHTNVLKGQDHEA